ncbi:MAG: hypothetical protein Ta2A_19070 [Treponemataceae bacterium]|nr:MAG: hypothetical protein Ta2A_19070 [Treponemataceae bacterium]
MNIPVKRAFFAVSGVAVLGVGVGVMRYASFGVDSYSCLTDGLSKTIGLSFGTTLLLLNIVLLICVLIFDRTKIGLGTFCNMAGVGYTADLTLFLINLAVSGIHHSFVLHVAALTAGIVIVCLGVAMYMEADMGISPYDALGVVISEKLHKQKHYKWIRITTDLLCVLGGFLMGSILGVGTVVMAFFTGPLISFFRWLLRRRHPCRNEFA